MFFSWPSLVIVDACLVIASGKFKSFTFFEDLQLSSKKVVMPVCGSSVDC